jgi:hypothetical protein
MRTVDAFKGPTGASVLAIVSALALASGCAKERSVESDAEVPPIDAGLDATGGGGTDAQVPPDVQDSATGSYFCARDGGSTDGDAAPSDAGADDSPAACTPAACEAPDGGVDGDRPPWGCPEACDPPCEGDTVCCDNGRCQPRSFHDCDCDGACDVELTLIEPLLCFGARAGVTVCNRGISGVASAGQLVRFEIGGEVFCEAETPEPLGPCECARTECTEALEPIQTENIYLITVNPDGPERECGNPYGNTVHREGWFCD